MQYLSRVTVGQRERVKYGDAREATFPTYKSTLEKARGIRKVEPRQAGHGACSLMERVRSN